MKELALAVLLGAAGMVVEIQETALGRISRVKVEEARPGQPGYWQTWECKQIERKKRMERWRCSVRSTGNLEIEVTR